MSRNIDRLSSYRDMIDRRLGQLMPEEAGLYQKEVFKASRYSLLAKGKRLRPFLCLSFCEACGGNAEDALDFAAAIEMIHCYSLIHDDLPCMDDSDTRRGVPSCHKAFGYSTALLAGDGLLNRAFEVMSAQYEKVSPLGLLKAISTMSASSGVYGMIGGQVIDLRCENRLCSKNELYKMAELKTAALISGACKSGCYLAGSDEEKANAAYEYGHAIGIAFQIIDDMLDVEGDDKKVGKPGHLDEQNGKNTFVTVYGMDKCRNMAKELTTKALDYANMFGENGPLLKDLALWLLKRDH